MALWPSSPLFERAWPARGPHPIEVRMLAWPWRELWRFDVLESTQTCGEGLAQGPHDAAGVVLQAERQTAGRGRAGRHWVSPPGGLYVTVLLPMPLRAGVPDPPPWADRLPLLAAQACREALLPRRIAAKIKWPNDLMADDRKLGGVLGSWVPAAPGRPPVAVLGMGLNWLNDLSEPATRGRFDAVAASDLCPGLTLHDRQAFLDQWLLRLAAWQRAWLGDAEAAAAQLRSQVEEALWARGRRVRIEDVPGGGVHGRLLGLAADGAVRLQPDGAPETVLYAGRIAAVLADPAPPGASLSTHSTPRSDPLC